MQQNEMKDLIDGYIKAYNAFDIDAMLLDMHNHISFQNISDGHVNLSTEGISELRNAAEQACHLFKSRRQTVTDYQFSGNTATVQIDFAGELSVDIPDGPKAGEILKLKGKSEFINPATKYIKIKQHKRSLDA